MKKFLTLLSVAALTVTAFATVASAAITEDIYKPEWVVEVVDVDEEGYAQIDVSIEMDTELAYTVSKGKYTGAALSMTDLILTFDEEIFDASDISGDTTSFGGFGTLVYNKVEDVYKVSFLWNNDATLTKVGKTFYHGCFWALLNEDYAGKTAEEINAMDFATVVKAGLQIADWAKVTGDLADINSFYSDGTATFDCAYRVGAEPVTPPAPPADPDFVMTEKTDADAAWEAETGKNAVYWGVKFAEGKFNNYSKAVFTAGEDVRERVFKAGNDFDVNGEVEFAIVVVAPEAITNIVTADIQ